MSEHAITKHTQGLLVHHRITPGNHSLFDSQGRVIANYMDERDAEYICRAVNAHDALVAACACALAIERSVTQGQERKLREGYETLLETALARVKGGAS